MSFRAGVYTGGQHGSPCDQAAWGHGKGRSGCKTLGREVEKRPWPDERDPGHAGKNDGHVRLKRLMKGNSQFL